MWMVSAACFLFALAVSAAANRLLIRVAPRLGFVDRPSGHKAHAAATPLGGGLAITAGVIATAGLGAAGVLFLSASPDAAGLPESIAVHVPGLLSSLEGLGAVLSGALLLTLMGLVDDRRGLSPGTKLLFQVAAGGILVAGGISVTLFLPGRLAGSLVTVVWIVFVTNAFNLLDNMDGLSAGVALVISAVFFVVAVETGQLFIAAFLSVTAGALLGFLLFNFPPAKIFMGDAGSYTVGYLLGATAVMFTFIPEGAAHVRGLPLALPFILFAVPFYDTLSVIVIRLREGRHPFDADRRHFSHRLTDLGMNTREAVLTIYVATLVTAFPAVYLYELTSFALLGAVAQALLVLCLVALLEEAGARKHRL